ncbi:MAG: ATP-binding protein [Firmicutes bacterium]|nr:ATP-binding protein [Bacillota bacterium]
MSTGTPRRFHIAVASGKGGTGKTTVAIGMARTIGETQLLDADAEEPNIHLFFPVQWDKETPVQRLIPEVNFDRCTYCGRCASTCQFNALVVFGQKLLFFEELCHGCGACSLVCPEKAVTEKPRRIGVIRGPVQWGRTLLWEARLEVGEASGTQLIREMKHIIRQDLPAVIDAAPGASCPVMEAIKGSDYCLLVTEPTPFGLSDLQIAVEAVRELGVPLGVVINRSTGEDHLIDEFCAQAQLPILARIPFNRAAAEAYSRGQHPVDAVPGFAEIFAGLWRALQAQLEVQLQKEGFRA